MHSIVDDYASGTHVDDALVRMTARYLEAKLQVRDLYRQLDVAEARLKDLERELNEALPKGMTP